MKAFVPPGWVAQEALRLDLYRRISTAGDHDQLAARPRRDRGPLRRAAARGRDAVRRRVAAGHAPRASASRRSPRTSRRSGITPVAIPDALLLDLTERVFGATYHAAKQTLNLAPERVFGTDLVRYVERWLLEAAGRDIPDRVR